MNKWLWHDKICQISLSILLSTWQNKLTCTAYLGLNVTSINIKLTCTAYLGLNVTSTKETTSIGNDHRPHKRSFIQIKKQGREQGSWYRTDWYCQNFSYRSMNQYRNTFKTYHSRYWLILDNTDSTRVYRTFQLKKRN